MKHSNKLLIVTTAVVALSIYVGASIVYANTSNKNDETGNSLFSLNNKTIKGNGQIVTEVRKISSFNSINVSGFAKIVVEKGKENSVNISTDQNLQPYLKVLVENNQLVIRTKKNVGIAPSQAMNIIITSKSDNFSDITTAGKIMFTAKNVNSNQLNVKIAGETIMGLSGNMKITDFNLAGKSDVTLNNINGTAINVNSAGNSMIHLSGNSNNLSLNSAGKSDIDAKNLTTNNLKVMGAGDMNITARVLKSIQVTALGKVNVNYYGNPGMINKMPFGNITVQKEGN